MSKSIVRSVKNATKGYSHVQVKVRNATSNDAWGPSGTEMSEIAQTTFNSQGDLQDIMEILDKRLNDKGKNWRHVLKSLKVLDYCLHEGSEHVVTWARNNIYIIKTLREFQYVDEESRDVGLNVRSSAKELTSLILDEDRLRAERKDRKNWKSRVTGLEEYGPAADHAGGSEPAPRQSRRTVRVDDNDLEYRLAIEASKNQEEEDRKRREGRTPAPAVAVAASDDDDDLRKALKLSEEEEELRRRQLEDKNAQSLFDDTPAQQPQATGWNQGYQQQGAVDWFGNPVDQQQQQQPQSTGYLNNAYQQSQQTGFQAGYGYNQYQQPQQTGFDQNQYQQSYLQPQQTSFNMNNPYSQQQQQPTGFEQQQQQQPLQPQSTLQAGNNNPWASTTQDDSLKPQPTGSNNPFASSFTRPQQSTPQKQQAPSLSALQEQRTQTQFNQSFAAPAQQQQQQPQNPQHAHLNALLASGEGQDTFGNVGNLRIPAQHTAPGTFINSAGTGGMRLQPNQTGTNPFLASQWTGMPSQQQQQQMMYPAQTGPVGTGFGGSSNPFGSPSRQGQGGGQGQGGSLIDF